MPFLKGLSDKSIVDKNGMILLLAILLSFIAPSFLVEVCNEVKQNPIGQPCDLSRFVNSTSLKPCKAESEQDCLSKGCCWNKGASKEKCFMKPKKCYVDLRYEKCTYPRDSVYGIYTGYSANGSYCHVTGIAISNSQTRKILGYIHNDGYRINPEVKDECRIHWNYSVTIKKNGNCSVKIISKSNTQAIKGGVKDGQLQFGKNCVVQDTFGHFYSFPVSQSLKCMCQVDAWVEAKDEQVNVSMNMLKYVRDLENQSSCTQVLGNMIRTSWMNRVAPLNRKAVDVVVDALANLTKQKDVREFTPLDATVLLQSTRKISDYSFYEGIDPSSATNMVTKATSAANNLIWRFAQSSSESSSLVEAPAALREQAAKNDSKVKFEIFQTLNTIAKTVALHLPKNQELDLHADNKYIDLRVAVASYQNVTKLTNQTGRKVSKKNGDIQEVSAKLPDMKPGYSSEENLCLMSVFYDFPVSNQDASKRASDYLSVNLWNLYQGSSSHLSVPVEFTMAWTNTTRNSSKLSCEFLSKNSTAENEIFSDFGCWVEKYNEHEVTCRCNHTTNFAVLLKFTGDSISPEHSTVLKIMSLVLGGLSVAALAVTLLVFIACRESLIKDRMLIHFHLILALFGGYVSLMISTLFTSKTKIVSPACLACAIATHFFFLGVFFWSLVEGFYLFYKIVLVFQRKWVECLPTYAPIVGWLCPAIIVTITFVFSRTWLQATPGDSFTDSYVSSYTCFLNQQSGFVWSFAGPVAFIMLLNLSILIKVVVVIYSSSVNSSRYATTSKATRITDSLRRSSRGALILMPILGIPWIVGFAYNFYSYSSNAGIVAGTAAAYLQCLLVGIQGILIFLFYCVYNADVKSAYALSARRRKSASSLDFSGQRKRSRIPLLFSGGDTNSESGSRRNTMRTTRTQSQCYQTRRSTSAGVKQDVTGSSTPTYGRTTSINEKNQANGVKEMTKI